MTVIRKELERRNFIWASPIHNHYKSMIHFCRGAGGLEKFFDISGMTKITACFSDRRPKGRDYYELRKRGRGDFKTPFWINWYVADIDNTPALYESVERFLEGNFGCSGPVFIWIELDA